MLVEEFENVCADNLLDRVGWVHHFDDAGGTEPDGQVVVAQDKILLNVNTVGI